MFYFYQHPPISQEIGRRRRTRRIRYRNQGEPSLDIVAVAPDLQDVLLDGDLAALSAAIDDLHTRISLAESAVERRRLTALVDEFERRVEDEEDDEDFLSLLPN